MKTKIVWFIGGPKHNETMVVEESRYTIRVPILDEEINSVKEPLHTVKTDKVKTKEAVYKQYNNLPNEEEIKNYQKVDTLFLFGGFK